MSIDKLLEWVNGLPDEDESLAETVSQLITVARVAAIVAESLDPIRAQVLHDHLHGLKLFDEDLET